MKRYVIIVQHEVVVYAKDKKAAEGSLLNNPFLKDRTNVRCVSITEIPLYEKTESVIDERKAPGA